MLIKKCLFLTVLSKKYLHFVNKSGRIYLQLRGIRMENVIKWKTTLTKTRVPEKKPLTRAQTWDYYYQVAVYYYNKNKNLNLKRRDTVLDENGLEVKLGNWLQIQRSRRSAGSLSPSQIQKLDDIKMPWKTEMSKKEKRKLFFYFAEEYYIKNGNLLIPSSYVVNLPKLGIDLQVGQWIRRQREYYRMGLLTDEQIRALKKIGMVFDYRETIWLLKYEMIKKYYDENGNINFDLDFTLEDEQLKFNPHKFLAKQRIDYNKGLLSTDKVNLLKAIGLKFKNDSEEWNQKYACLLKYYQENGNINVPSGYMATYTLDKSFSLKAWILEQRKKLSEGNLTSEQVILLDRIGMIWNLRSNTTEKIFLMNYYHLNKCKNPTVIKNMSILELYAKINFCLDTGRCLLNPDNTLNEVFTMSSKDMFLNFDVSLEDLIIKYKDSLCLIRK